MLLCSRSCAEYSQYRLYSSTLRVPMPTSRTITLDFDQGSAAGMDCHVWLTLIPICHCDTVWTAAGHSERPLIYYCDLFAQRHIVILPCLFPDILFLHNTMSVIFVSQESQLCTPSYALVTMKTRMYTSIFVCVKGIWRETRGSATATWNTSRRTWWGTLHWKLLVWGARARRGWARSG